MHRIVRDAISHFGTLYIIVVDHSVVWYVIVVVLYGMISCSSNDNAIDSDNASGSNGIIMVSSSSISNSSCIWSCNDDSNLSSDSDSNGNSS